MIHEMGQLQVDLLRRVAELERQVDSLVKPEVPRWVDWTPTVTQLGSVTVTVETARYATYGKIAIVQARLTVTGSGTAGNAIVIGGQPAAIQAANTGDTRYAIGVFVVLDSGTTNYTGVLAAVGATDWRATAHSGGNIGVNPSFALADGDQIGIEAAFERA